MFCGAGVLPATVSVPSEVVHHAGGPQLEQIHLVDPAEETNRFLSKFACI